MTDDEYYIAKSRNDHIGYFMTCRHAYFNSDLKTPAWNWFYNAAEQLEAGYILDDLRYDRR